MVGYNVVGKEEIEVLYRCYEVLMIEFLMFYVVLLKWYGLMLEL